MPSRSTIAWMTSGGLLAPPIQPVLQRRHVAVGERVVVEEVDEVRRDAAQHGHALALDQRGTPRSASQRSIRIIAPPVISGGSTPVHAPAMWKNGMWFITRLEPSMSIASEIEHSLRSTRLRVHGALRVAGGAARVDDEARVVVGDRVDVDRRRPARRGTRPTPRGADHDHVAQLRQVLLAQPGEHREIVDADELADHHQQLRVGLAQDVGDLLGLVARVDRRRSPRRSSSPPATAGSTRCGSGPRPRRGRRARCRRPAAPARPASPRAASRAQVSRRSSKTSASRSGCAAAVRASCWASVIGSHG